MSLVVAEIQDGAVSLVADTKVTYPHDDTRTRHVLDNAIPKLVILRRDLCVGIAGNDPVGVIDSLIAVRERSIPDVLELASTLRHASVVVAAVGDAPVLWQVTAGRVEDRTTVGRAWAGDHAGYEVFQEQYAVWPDGTEPAFRLLAALQWLVTWNPIASIGGYHTRVGTTADGFRFVADTTHIGPEELQGVLGVDRERLSLRLTSPPGTQPSVMSLICAPGIPPTFGALSYFIAPLGLALLFTHDRPSESRCSCMLTPCRRSSK